MFAKDKLCLTVNSCNALQLQEKGLGLSHVMSVGNSLKPKVICVNMLQLIQVKYCHYFPLPDLMSGKGTTALII
jgi:hypothetical protein